MTNNELAAYLAFAKELASESGKMMLEYFRSDRLTTTWKEKNSPVTIADSKINTHVIERVKARFPKHGILGEEESFNPDSKVVWVVDPIDGTNLFNLGMPNSTFCLALVVDGEVYVAVVYDPYLKRMFWATRGGGTFRNGEVVQVVDTTDFNHGYIFAQADKTDNSGTTAEIHKRLKKRGVKIMAIPSFTYMALAILEGKMLAAFMPYGSPWDAAAISLLIQEAGGKTTDLNGSERKYNEWGDGILVSNGAVHDELVAMIKDADTRN